MQKCSALILLAGVFALLTAERVAATPVTWDFIVTSCSNQQGSSYGCDPKAKYPVSLATLTLAGPDSSGSATLDAFFGTTVLTGDPFDFVLSQNSLEFASTDHPLGAGWANGTPPPGPAGIVDYDIAWRETAGVLTSVNISFLTEFDEVNRLGLTGGMAGSDGEMVGCSFALCQVSGYWVDSPVVAAPEPGSLALVASAFGLWGLTGRRRALHGVRRFSCFPRRRKFGVVVNSHHSFIERERTRGRWLTAPPMGHNS